MTSHRKSQRRNIGSASTCTTSFGLRATRALCGLAVLQAAVLSGCSQKTVAPAPSTAAAPAASSSSRSSPEAEPTDVAPPAADVAAVAKAIESLPVTMKVAQRTTTAVPGAAGELSVTVDDVTRGQVMVSLLDKQGAPLAGPASMKQDQAISFRLGEATYAARVSELSNVLVGDDVVTIIIDRFAASDPSAAAARPRVMDYPSAGNTPAAVASPKSVRLTEQQKMEMLLSIIAAQRNVKFIRNGTAYSAGEAADHMRTKLENAKGRVTTAADFIEQIASKSLVSGKDYLIEFSDGRTITAGAFLRKELSRIEKLDSRH